MQACHRLWLRAWSSSKVEGGTEEECPACEEALGLLAEVMLFLNSVDIIL
jgi:hypothetical protein